MISSCGSITLPNTEVCGIKGQVQNGMFCSTTISREERELDLDETIDFLQANEEHGAALCQSSKDWTKIKTTIESACKLLGKRCEKELVKKLVKSIKKVQSLTKF